jgi:hypothetical protein
MTTGQINSENENPFKFKRDEYSTIEELKEAFARNKGGVLDAYDFKFTWNPENKSKTEILGNNVPLKACLELQLIRTSWELLKGEVIIHAIRRPQLCAERLGEIDSTNSIHDLEEKLVKLEEILRKPINREGEKTMLAREDRDIVLAAVQKDGLALQHASDEFYNNHDIMYAAVQQNVSALQSASEVLKADRKFMLVAVQQNGEALAYAPENLKADSEIVLAAEKQNEEAPQDVPQELTDNKNVKPGFFSAFKAPMINFKIRITGAPSTSSSVGRANNTAKTPLLDKDKKNRN